MTAKYYYVVEEMEGYEESASKELANDLKQLGFSFKPAELGGGPSEIIQQIVAYLSVHEFWTGVASSLVATQLERLLLHFYKWHFKNKRHDNTILPIVEFDLHKDTTSGEGYFLQLRIDKKYTSKELENLIESAKKENNFKP